MNTITTTAAALALTSLGIAGVQAATTWTGATDNDWGTPSNWNAGVPDGTDAAIIGTSATVTKVGNYDDGAAGNNTSQFTSLSIAEGSTLSYTGGGDFRGETWNIDGTVTMGAVSGFQNPGTTFSFGSNGSLTVNGNMWGNGHDFNLNASINLNSDPAGTLVTQKFFAWTGSNPSGFGTVTDNITGGVTQLADNTTPVNPGEWSFFTQTGGNGYIGVQYISTVPEPSSAALLGLGCISLILRRRK